MNRVAHRWLRAAALAGMLCLDPVGRGLAAQLPASTEAAPEADTVSAAFARGGWRLGVHGGLALASLAVMPLDEELRELLRGADQDPSVLGSTASAFGQLGGAAVPLVGGGVWLVGMAFGRETLTDVTGQALQGMMAAAAVTLVGKTLAGRERPTEREDGQWSYALGRGFSDSDFRALPSGHTAQAFALATVLARELEEHGFEAVRYLRPLFFGAATLTGLSRIYQDRHWASDVLLGAVVGSLAGRFTQDRHALGRRGGPLVQRIGDGGLAVGFELGVP